MVHGNVVVPATRTAHYNPCSFAVAGLTIRRTELSAGVGIAAQPFTTNTGGGSYSDMRYSDN